MYRANMASNASEWLFSPLITMIFLFRDALIDEKTCQAPHLADLMSGTYLPEQLADIHELEVLYNQLDSMTTKDSSAAQQHEAELLFDRLILKD